MTASREARPAAAAPAALSDAKAALLQRWLRGAGRGAGVVASIPRRPAGAAAPLSFTQLRLWFLDQLAPGSAAYNAPIGLRLRGALDIAALERSLERIVARHEILRTTFAAAGGEAVQVVAERGQVALRRTDLGALPEPAREEALARAIRSETVQPFDLARGPLFRSQLLRLGEEDHVVLLTWHHILADGWSGGVFARELAALYGGFAEGREVRLPALPIQYADYAAWQRTWLTGEVLERELAYWRARLAGVTADLDLPADRPRPAVQDSAGDVVRFTLRNGLADELEALGRREDASAFMVGLAALAAYVHRLTGRTDIVVGTPIASRTRPELEELIGFFANTLVLRTDTSGDPTFRELLGRVRQGASEAYAHQDLPFERLVESLRLPRDLSRSPLFQVLFSWQREPMADFRIGRLAVTPMELHSATSKFDLTLGVQNSPTGARGTLEYATALFDRATAERLVERFMTLLEGVAAGPDRRLSALPLLSARERRQVVLAWNRTAVDWPSDRCVHHLIEGQAARTPEAVAVRCGEERLTYAELDRRAEGLAARLAAAGVGPEVRVGICLERSPDLVVAMLGVLKAGGAYVPLDPAYPAERTAHLLGDTGAAAVVTRSSLAGRITSPAAGPVPRLVLIDPGREADAGEVGPVERPAALVWPGNVAYVLYTSGSTGRPKGVEVSHHSVVSFLAATALQPGVGPDDVVLAVSTVCFDIAVMELLLPLTVGATVVVAVEEDVRDGTRLRALLAATGATVLDATPATWRLLLAAGWEGDPRLRAISTGEALTPQLAAALRRRAAEVWNLYGPTESTVWAAGQRLDEDRDPVPVGRPTGNTRLYVVDRQHRPVAIGVPGELLIGGEGLARGYRGLPAATADRFVPDPFGKAGGRLYRTGDLVRWRPDGTLEYIGRLDHQVKLHGYRIEPGEIEAALRRHPALSEAAVVLRPDAPGGPRLVAYVVPRPGAALRGDELRGHLSATLPAFMVPAEYVSLPALPVNANGKLDRRALAGAGGTRLATAAAHVVPRSRMARVVAAVWREVLGVERVGLDDNFFELGGHSLLAIRTQRRLEGVLGRELAVVTLFQHPTVRTLSEFLDAGTAPDRAAPADRARAPRDRRLAEERRRRSDRSAGPGAPADTRGGGSR